jgi:Tfp pilus assembly protein PilV
MQIQKVPGTARFRREKATAFTLMEVIVAVLVLTTISTAFYLGLSTCFSVIKTSREDIRATQIMMQKLEAVRLCTWSELTNFSFKEPYDPTATSTNSGGVYFYGTVTKGAIGFPSGVSYSNNMCVVTVDLNWTNNASGQAHDREMQTYYARYGLQSYIWGALQ